MRLERDDLEALARGYALLGSGGGGSTTMLELILDTTAGWPLEVAPVDALDPATPCLGVAFVGSTMLLGERMPGAAPFAALLRAVERWLGHPVPAVCSLDGGGMNRLAPRTLAGSHTAVPGLDQMSLFVDRVPGLVFACETGADGVALVEATRAIDAERVVRSAIIQAGGVGCAVLAGFTVGDLREHAIADHLARALALGRSFLAHRSAPLPVLADVLGGTLLAEGRIVAGASSGTDPHVNAVEIAGLGGAVHRIVTRSETLAVLTDGLLVAAAPEIIVLLDAVSREILEVTELAPGRTVAAVALPAPEWWNARPERRARVVPSAYGLVDLDAA